MQTIRQRDEQWIKLALEQADLAAQRQEVPIGAVLVKDNQLIAQGHNRTINDKDPSAHAEIIVLRKAGQQLHNYRLTGTSLYVTLEPCVMCMGAILQARVERLIFGAYDLRAGACESVFELARSPALNHHIHEVKGGVLEELCRARLVQFFRARRKR